MPVRDALQFKIFGETNRSKVIAGTLLGQCAKANTDSDIRTPVDG